MNESIVPPPFKEALEREGVVAELKALHLWREKVEKSDSPSRAFSPDDLWRFCRSFTRRVRVASKERLKVGRKLRRAADAFETFEEESATEAPAWMTLAMNVDSDVAPDEIKPQLGRPYRTKVLKRAGSVAEVLRGLADTVERVSKARASAKGPKVNVDEMLFRSRWEVVAMKKTGKRLDEIGVLLLRVMFGKNIDLDSYTKQRTRERKKRSLSTDKKRQKT